MESKLEDIFDEDLGFDDEVIENEEVENNDDDIFSDEIIGENDDNKNISILDEFLTLKGVNDSKIKILEEDNTEKEVSFYDLSKEDQLELLNSFTESKQELNESELSFLNDLKSKNLNIEEYLNNYKEEILKEQNIESVPTYEIDAYDDQELYLLDLKSKFDLTDEELISELEKELANPDLFKKKTDSLRKEYKDLENQYKEDEKTNFEQQRKQEYDTFSDTMVDIAVKTPEFYGIELEDNEKNDVLSYLLDLDENGTSNFYKELNTPEKLYEAAWFLKYGKDAFDALRGAYETEISKIKKDNKNKVVIVDNKKKSNSIHDLI